MCRGAKSFFDRFVAIFGNVMFCGFPKQYQLHRGSKANANKNTFAFIFFVIKKDNKNWKDVDALHYLRTVRPTYVS